MEGDFVWRTYQAISWMEHPELTALGVTHGFFGSTLNGLVAEEAERAAREIFGAAEYRSVSQVHGCEIIDGQSPLWRAGTQADGILLRRAHGGKIAAGIRTADCLPVILATTECVALVHAGWRGLANGILERALEAFSPATRHEVVAVVGPAAGADEYEVGPEVLSAIGASAVYVSTANPDRALLNLYGTARNQLTSRGVTRVFDAGIGTISDRRFSSHRRDGKGAGRNLTLVVV